jgi:hypothetical protein
LSDEEIDALSPAEKEQLWIDGVDYKRRTGPIPPTATREQVQAVMGVPAKDEPQGQELAWGYDEEHPIIHPNQEQDDIVDAELVDPDGKIIWAKHEARSPVSHIIEGIISIIKDTERLFEAEVPFERQTHILHFMYLARDELLKVEDQYGKNNE